MSRAAAAPRYQRRIGLATVVLGLACLSFAASQASAGQAAAATVQAAPAPDPKPGPKPDPKPAQPKPPARVTPPPPPLPPPSPPPPPPPATRPTARSSTAAPVKRRTVQRATLRTKAAASQVRARLSERKAAARRKAAAAATLRARRRARADAARRAAKKQQAARARARARAQERARLRIAGASLDHEALPAPLAAPSGPKLSSAVPVFLPLVGLGFLLLLGASALSVRRIPLPAVAQPLYARRSDVAAIGFGAIALGLLLLNATVFL